MGNVIERHAQARAAFFLGAPVRLLTAQRSWTSQIQKNPRDPCLSLPVPRLPRSSLRVIWIVDGRKDRIVRMGRQVFLAVCSLRTENPLCTHERSFHVSPSAPFIFPLR